MNREAVPTTLVPTTTTDVVTGEERVLLRDELAFLRKYAGCLDEVQAMQEAMVESNRRADILARPHVKAEMARIQAAWRHGARHTADFAVGEHERLMEKFEGQYDNDKDSRAKMAGTLAKMSETRLRATGVLGAEQGAQLPTVIVQINTGETVQPQPKTVEG